MWYLSWILGLSLALTFGVLDAIGHEVTQQPLSRPSPPS